MGVFTNLLGGAKEQAFHSDLERRHGRSVKKSVFLRGVDHKRAIKIQNDVQTFYDIATGIGIKTPEIYDLHIDEPQRNRFTLVLEQRDVGKDLAQELVQSRNPIDLVARSYLPAFRNAIAYGYVISLDPPPTNFSANGDYLDLFPPRRRDDQGMVLEYGNRSPDPYLEQRYFSPKQSVVVYSQLLRTLLQNSHFKGRDLETLKRHIIETFGPEAENYLDLNPNVLRTILNERKPAGSHCDTLRGLAGEAVYYRLNSKFGYQQFKDIFRMTHIIEHYGELPSPENIRAAADVLRAVYNT